MQNRITEILNIQYPIVQGAMSWVTNAEFVAVVSNAGGLGILGPHGSYTTNPSSMDEIIERMRNEIRKIKTLTDKPFAAPLVVSYDLSRIDDVIDMLIAEEVPVALVNGLDNFDYMPVFSKLRGHGIKTIYRPLTATVGSAKYAQRLGGDIFVATGFDEGGTVPEKIIGSFSIVSEIVDAVDMPVMLAGGIADVRAVRAAFALGAEGVFVGTVLIATHENPAAKIVKDLIVKHNAHDLHIFRTTPAYYRSIPTPYSQQLVAMDEQGESREAIASKMYGEQGLKVGMLDGDIHNGYITVGNGISYIKEIRSVKAVIEDLMQDFNRSSTIVAA